MSDVIIYNSWLDISSYTQQFSLTFGTLNKTVGTLPFSVLRSHDYIRISSLGLVMDTSICDRMGDAEGVMTEM